MRKRRSRIAGLEPSRANLRAIKTFSDRVDVGTDVAGQATISRQEAVKRSAKKFNRSKRYVWGTVKLGKRMHAAAIEILEKEVAGNKRPRARAIASVFLLNELRNQPRPMTEIEALAETSGISISTLRRASKNLGVKKRHVGGRHGHWTWELPPDVKKSFGIEVKDDQF